jgi:hypothetical protein
VVYPIVSEVKINVPKLTLLLRHCRPRWPRRTQFPQSVGPSRGGRDQILCRASLEIVDSMQPPYESLVEGSEPLGVWWIWCPRRRIKVNTAWQDSQGSPGFQEFPSCIGEERITAQTLSPEEGVGNDGAMGLMRVRRSWEKQFESFNGGWVMGQHPYKSSRLSLGLS